MIGVVVASVITDIKNENRELKSLYLKPLEEINTPKPGQFLMVWVPELEEIPISVSKYSDGLIRITVAKRGKTTRYMHSLNKGDILGVKGPLGNYIEPEPDKKYLLVGGGYGIAPLMFFLWEFRSRSREVIDVIIGARTADLLAFEDEARKLRANVHVTTDDGSKGFKGTNIDLMKKLLKSEDFDIVVLCGPEQMLINGAKTLIENGINGFVLAEEYMKCGIGLCGSCELGRSGLLVCKDGPVFDVRTFLKSLGLL